MLEPICRGVVVLALASPFLCPAFARGQDAPADSTVAFPLTSPPDSLAVAPPDSLVLDARFAGADSVGGPDGPRAGPYDLMVIRPDWVEVAPVGPRELSESRPEHMAHAVALLPNAVVRTAGAEGAPAFVGLDALAAPAPELWYDGVPSRSPADQDPALWDRSAIPLLSVDASLDPGRAWWGDPAIRAELDEPLPGRTLMRTHFTSTDLESYARGVSITTPQSARLLRLDFEEWKTEEGFLFTQSPSSPGAFGKAKMRRFRAGAEFASDHGRTSVTFGRGRRFHRGNVATDNGSVERWTGEVAVGWDREDARANWRGRAFHLDFHDDDSLVDETRDATRLGFTLQRTPRRSGFGLAATAERWFAAFDAADRQSHPDPRYVARVASSWRSPPRAGWTTFVAGETAYAEQTPDKVDLGGGLQLTRRGGVADLSLGVGRHLRTPTLAETDGLTTVEYAGGASIRHRGGGPLPLERQDRAFARLTGAAGRLRWGAGIEHARLTRGIGWLAPENLVQGETVEVTTLSGLELDVTQVTGQARVDLGSGRLGLIARAHGHAVLGDAPLSPGGNRGAGWPRARVDAALRIWRQVASVHNRLAMEGRVQWTGEHHDDLLAAFGPSNLVPATTRFDLRFILKVRDAEMYLAVDNLTDQPLTDILGTIERPRQLRWGLVWPFFN